MKEVRHPMTKTQKASNFIYTLGNEVKRDDTHTYSQTLNFLLFSVVAVCLFELLPFHLKLAKKA